MSKMYVGCNPLKGWYAYKGEGDRTKYLRDDMTTHKHMTGDGGTYFNTREEAQEVVDRYNAMYWVVPTPDNRTLRDGVPIWRDMTPEEKGALLLAKHEGRKIQFWSDISDQWVDTNNNGRLDLAYRVKPEPEVKTVTIRTGWPEGGDWDQGEDDDDTHSITYKIIDGEPICGVYADQNGNTITVEKL